MRRFLPSKYTQLSIPTWRACGAVLFVSLISCDNNKQNEPGRTEITGAPQVVEQGQRDAERQAVEAKAHADSIALKARMEVEKATLRSEVDGIDRKLSYLRSRALRGAATTNADIQKALMEVDAKREVVKKEMTRLDQVAEMEWDSAKATMDTNLKALKTSLDSFEIKVTGKAAK